MKTLADFVKSNTILDHKTLNNQLNDANDLLQRRKSELENLYTKFNDSNTTKVHIILNYRQTNLEDIFINYIEHIPK